MTAARCFLVGAFASETNPVRLYVRRFLRDGMVELKLRAERGIIEKGGQERERERERHTHTHTETDRQTGRENNYRRKGSGGSKWCVVRSALMPSTAVQEINMKPTPWTLFTETKLNTTDPRSTHGLILPCNIHGSMKNGGFAIPDFLRSPAPCTVRVPEVLSKITTSCIYQLSA